MFTLWKLIVEGCNKWEWVEKVEAVIIYFKNRVKGGGKKCRKTFILVKYRNQLQHLTYNVFQN